MLLSIESSLKIFFIIFNLLFNYASHFMRIIYYILVLLSSCKNISISRKTLSKILQNVK